MTPTRNELMSPASDKQLELLGKYRQALYDSEVEKVVGIIGRDLKKTIDVGATLWEGLDGKFTGLKKSRAHDPSKANADNYFEACKWAREQLGLPEPKMGKIPAKIVVPAKHQKTIIEMLQAGKTLGKWDSSSERESEDSGERRQAIRDNYDASIDLVNNGVEGDELYVGRGFTRKGLSLTLTASWWEEKNLKTTKIKEALGDKWYEAPTEQQSSTSGAPAAQSQNIDQPIMMVMAIFAVHKNGTPEDKIMLKLRILAGLAEKKKADFDRVANGTIWDEITDVATVDLYLSPDVITPGRLAKAALIMFMKNVPSMVYMEFKKDLVRLSQMWEAGFKKAEAVSWLVKTIVDKGVDNVCKMKGNPLRCQVTMSGVSEN
jgi:hypothetical protein